MAYYRKSADQTLLVIGNYKTQQQTLTLPSKLKHIVLNNLPQLKTEGNEIMLEGYQAVIARWCSSYKFVSEIRGGRVPIIDISPPDVKIETTFFQRKFFSTTPYNYPQKQHKKRTSDLSEVPILRLFLKILPPSAPLPASYQIPPDCTLNGIFQSSDTFFLYPSRMFSISFSALAHC